MQFQFDEVAANVGCNTDRVMACLRSKDVAQLEAADIVSPFPGNTAAGHWYFLPVIDANFSQDLLYNLFEEGKVVRVPLLVGDDTDEGTSFAPDTSTAAEFMESIKDNYPHLSALDLRKISIAYPQDGFGVFANHSSYFAATQAAIGEASFTCAGIEMSNSFTKYNSPSKVWNYRYNVQDYAMLAAGRGVPHVSEKPAIFGVDNTGLCNGCSYSTYNAPMIPIVMSFWISFIISLDPNTYKYLGAPIWEPWMSDGNSDDRACQRIKFQLNDTVMEAVPEDQRNRCRLWKSLAAISEQ